MYPGQAPMTAMAGSQIQQQSAAQAQPFVAQPKKPKRRVLTSLTLEIFVYFGGWWDVFYYIVNILVFVWKGELSHEQGCSSERPLWRPTSHAACMADTVFNLITGMSTFNYCFICQASICPTPTAILPWSFVFHGFGFSSRYHDYF